MSEDDVQSEYMHVCPTEVLIYIFTYLKPKHIIKCRQVCWRWKLIVESLFKNELLWRKHCQNDFSEIFKSAYYKSKVELSWYNIYRSLSLWTCINQADVTLDEFASASAARDEIRDFQILKQGVLGVHTRGGIVYYNLATLKQSNRTTIQGEYLRYVENDDHLVVLGLNLDLYIERKAIKSCRHQLRESYPSVKNFLLNDDHCYYVSVDNEIYICYLGSEQFQSSLVIGVPDGVICLGYKAGYLHVLSFQRHIFKVVGCELVFLCTLNNSSNIFYVLRKYNFLDHLDWRIYFQWMYVLNRSVPRGSIRDIIVAKVYGNVVLVGSNSGVFAIYDITHTDDEVELFSTQPMKQFNFVERQDCPVLSNSPIVQIDVVEGEDSHTVLVGMPKKIAVLEFNHNTQNPRSVFSYEDLQSLKRVKMIEPKSFVSTTL